MLKDFFGKREDSRTELPNFNEQEIENTHIFINHLLELISSHRGVQVLETMRQEQHSQTEETNVEIPLLTTDSKQYTLLLDMNAELRELISLREFPIAGTEGIKQTHSFRLVNLRQYYDNLGFLKKPNNIFKALYPLDVDQYNCGERTPRIFARYEFSDIDTTLPTLGELIMTNPDFAPIRNGSINPLPKLS